MTYERKPKVQLLKVGAKVTAYFHNDVPVPGVLVATFANAHISRVRLPGDVERDFGSCAVLPR